jgi:hypothetical protein
VRYKPLTSGFSAKVFFLKSSNRSEEMD